jgi:hypothetical protein
MAQQPVCGRRFFIGRVVSGRRTLRSTEDGEYPYRYCKHGEEQAADDNGKSHDLLQNSCDMEESPLLVP